jgi:tetratricopeptide (TPR) repeat protein
MKDLEEAIEKAKRAVNKTAKEHQSFTGRLNNLGNELESRYERRGKMEDPKEAIRMTGHAVEVTPDDHPDLAGRLNNLGNKLGRRYERKGKMEDLEEAIRLTRQAVEVSPEDHPDLAARLSSLAYHLLSFKSLSSPEALNVLLCAWNCHNAILLEFEQSIRFLSILSSCRLRAESAEKQRRSWLVPRNAD